MPHSSYKKIETIIPYQKDFYLFSNPTICFAYYKNKKINLLTGQESSSSLSSITKIFDKIKLGNSFNHPRLFHLFYEWGHFCEGPSELIDENDLLVIDIHYTESEKISLSSSIENVDLTLKKQINFKEYKEKFYAGRRQLMEGNCYQFNLTIPFEFKLSSNLMLQDFAKLLWGKNKVSGAYGSITSIPFFKKILVSNSPECLFQIKKNRDKFKIETMPIKGTLPLSNFTKDWARLRGSKKDQAELFMITDLMRNDLSRIEKPIAIVEKKKAPLVVPGIIHQYSLISVLVSSKVTLARLLKSIFPGGSITGAPKKRVMTILEKLEDSKREFYCGSTLILYKELKAASINIRSATYCQGNLSLKYNAGGGITLLSDCEDEFQEAHLKMQSFILSLDPSFRNGKI